MKPAGVFDVKYRPRQRDMFNDWIQAGETFHLSEQLRALIAQDCYPRFQGVNSFSLDDIITWLRTYLTVQVSSITYYNNRYKISALLTLLLFMLVTCYQIPLSVAWSWIGSCPQNNGRVCLEVAGISQPAHDAQHPSSFFLFTSSWQAGPPDCSIKSSNWACSKKTCNLVGATNSWITGWNSKVSHTHTHIHSVFIHISTRFVAGPWLMSRAPKNF